jgi:hypothetical protein
MTEITEQTKKQLQAIKEDHYKLLEYWAKSGNDFGKNAANLILGVQV